MADEMVDEGVGGGGGSSSSGGAQGGRGRARSPNLTDTWMDFIVQSFAIIAWKLQTPEQMLKTLTEPETILAPGMVLFTGLERAEKEQFLTRMCGIIVDNAHDFQNWWTQIAELITNLSQDVPVQEEESGVSETRNMIRVAIRAYFTETCKHLITTTSGGVQTRSVTKEFAKESERAIMDKYWGIESRLGVQPSVQPIVESEPKSRGGKKRAVIRDAAAAAGAAAVSVAVPQTTTETDDWTQLSYMIPSGSIMFATQITIWRDLADHLQGLFVQDTMALAFMTEIVTPLFRFSLGNLSAEAFGTAYAFASWFVAQPQSTAPPKTFEATAAAVKQLRHLMDAAEKEIADKDAELARMRASLVRSSAKLRDDDEHVKALAEEIRAQERELEATKAESAAIAAETEQQRALIEQIVTETTKMLQEQKTVAAALSQVEDLYTDIMTLLSGNPLEEE